MLRTLRKDRLIAVRLPKATMRCAERGTESIASFKQRNVQTKKNRQIRIRRHQSLIDAVI